MPVKPATVAAMAMFAAMAPSVGPASSTLNLRSPSDTAEAARLGEFGPDVPAWNRKSGEKRRRGNARKARRGWR